MRERIWTAKPSRVHHRNRIGGLFPLPHLSPSLPLLLKDPMPAHWYAVLTAVASAGVQFALFLRWLHRRMRNDEITRAFVRDIATNHLPHIYNALQKIAAEQGIELDETPLVRFVDLHGRHRNK